MRWIVWLSLLALIAAAVGTSIGVRRMRAEDGAAREAGRSMTTPAPLPLDAAPMAPSQPNVVLISLDTLAARHLGLYGYFRDTSQHLDAYARGATVFLEAYSTAPKTAESHMSIFTSLYPSVHGVNTIVDDRRGSSLDRDIHTFVQILKEHGYTTVGIHNGGFLGPEFGFGRGFDVYEAGAQHQAMEWLERKSKGEPFFLFYHTYWVHDPYCPKPSGDQRFTDLSYSGPIVHVRDDLRKLADGKDWAAVHGAFWDRVDKEDPEEVAHVVALYDTLIAQLDESLAVFLEAIDRLAPNTIVIIMSDHGEEFGQHGMFVHEQVYGETTHVPLIVRHPDLGHGRNVEQRVSLIDLAPTILDLLSIPRSEQFQGRSFARLLVGEGQPRPILIDFRGRQALIEGDHKLITHKGRHELYDLIEDPGEHANLLSGILQTFWQRLVGNEREDYRHLRAALLGAQAANVAKREALDVRIEAAELDEKSLERLRSLGYLE